MPEKPVVFVPLRPTSGPLCMMREQDLTEDLIRRVGQRTAKLYRRAVTMFRKLQADGWDFYQGDIHFHASHPDLDTVEELECRLSLLDIPLNWVEVIDVEFLLRATNQDS